MYRVFRVVLVLKVPSPAGENFDFRTKLNDIETAALKFNNRFKGLKGVTLSEVREREIELSLTIDAPHDKPINARELSSFSKKLYHEYGWSDYSRETAKLFTAKIFHDVTSDHVQSHSSLPLKAAQAANKQPVPMSMSDSQALEALDALLKIQDVGPSDIRVARKKSIEAIKSILMDILS